MKTVLFDIDGTLADIQHRRSALDSNRPNWDLFNSKMGEDSPNGPVVALYKAIWESGSFEVILVSGRSEEHREITERWLVWNEIPFGELIMRPAKDYRPDVEIKREILEGLRSRGKQILFVVDDRRSVVEMWRKNGITCFQCDEGDF